MTTESWMEEFYPIEAKAVAATGNVMAMVEHAIKKWEGLRNSNLNKHNVELKNIGLKYVGDLQIGADSCSLCVNYIGEDFAACEKCPLFQSLGHRCDNVGPFDVGGWGTSADRPNPEPMIVALNATKQFILDGKYDPDYECDPNEDDSWRE